MAETEWLLYGQGPDALSVQVRLRVDPHDVGGWNPGYQGRGLVLDYKADVTVNRMGMPYQKPLPASVFDAASGSILSLSGLMISRSWSTSVFDINPESGNHRTTFFIPLTDQDIETLEDHRQADALHLQFVLTGLAQITGQAIGLADNDNRIAPVTTVMRIESTRLPLTISRESWLKALATLGRIRHVVELPMPDIPLIASWDPVTQHYQRANQAYREGRYEDAVAACRKVVEGVATVLSQQWHIDYLNTHGKPRSFESWTAEIENRLKQAAEQSSEDPHPAAMLARLLQTAWSWTSPVHHFSGKIPHRDDVRFTLFVTTSLLDICAQVLRAHPHPLKDSGEDTTDTKS